MDNGMLAQLTLRILMAAFLGGLIGLERSSGDRPAGLRTHVLVATGSALLMVVSIYGIDGHPQARDPSRIASQVVSGIGFLGAGTILHEGLTVKGLTTAASLWIVSAIGLTVGCGMMALGIFATGITLITLILIRGLEKKVLPAGKPTRCKLHVILSKNPDSMMDVMEYLQERNIKTRILGIRNDPQRSVIEVDLSVKIGKYYNANAIISGLENAEAVKKVVLVDD
ncbi:MgtC/SapB family protein [Acidaminococcus fermentans]|jgi:putative Mg2+ transporter-C (MgtC) family protein|uniref:MgtC/SapB family protein n=1 Tax=Acidaminococcus fermentans TaxID=905 RepID=UPI00242EC160|nr:MgtC/SapB family protein [Acidaminococcus fermentans]